MPTDSVPSGSSAEDEILSNAEEIRQCLPEPAPHAHAALENLVSAALAALGASASPAGAPSEDVIELKAVLHALDHRKVQGYHQVTLDTIKSDVLALPLAAGAAPDGREPSEKALVDAINLCRSEANRSRPHSRKTSDHWTAVADDLERLRIGKVLDEASAAVRPIVERELAAEDARDVMDFRVDGATP